MALTLGTNCGFVTTAPTADPGGSATAADTDARGMKHVAPAAAVMITEIGFWVDNNTEAANFDIGFYSDAGAGEPEIRQQVSANNAKGTTSGWKKVTGLTWAIVAGTTYWLAVQIDDTTTTTNIDAAVAAGSGSARKASQTALPADWGTSTSTVAAGMVAIYAVVAFATGTPHQRFYGAAAVTGGERLDRDSNDFIEKYT